MNCLRPQAQLCTQTKHNNSPTLPTHTMYPHYDVLALLPLDQPPMSTTLLLASLSRVERHHLVAICYLSKIAIANTQENINAIAVIMPPSFDDTIIQQATTHRELTIAIPIMTIMKSWHQYISSSAPTMWPLNLWTRYWKMDDGAAGMQFDFDDEHTRWYK